MSGYIPLKEAKERLTGTARSLGLISRRMLELWLHAADNLPSQALLPSTVRTMHILQAAVREAPWHRLQQSVNMAWLNIQLPGISTAMKESVTGQLDISIRRLSILQSLAKCQSEPDKATHKAEVRGILAVKIMHAVFIQLDPVAVLCVELASASQGTDQGANTRPGTHHQQQRDRLQQGSQLLSRVATGLKHAQDSLLETFAKLRTIQAGLQGLGIVLTEGPADMLQSVKRVADRVIQFNIVWLTLLSQLPPNHNSISVFIEQVEWAGLDPQYLDDDDCHWVQVLLGRILAQPALLSKLQKKVSAQDLQRMVCSFCVTADQLAAKGMCAAQVLQFLLYLQDAGPDVKHDVQRRSGQHSGHTADSKASAASGSNTGNGRKVGGGSSKGQGADVAGGCGGVDGGDGDGLDDMQELLRLMYGNAPGSTG